MGHFRPAWPPVSNPAPRPLPAAARSAAGCGSCGRAGPDHGAGGRFTGGRGGGRPCSAPSHQVLRAGGMGVCVAGLGAVRPRGWPSGCWMGGARGMGFTVAVPGPARHRHRLCQVPATAVTSCAAWVIRSAGIRRTALAPDAISRVAAGRPARARPLASCGPGDRPKLSYRTERRRCARWPGPVQVTERDPGSSLPRHRNADYERLEARGGEPGKWHRSARSGRIECSSGLDSLRVGARWVG